MWNIFQFNEYNHLIFKSALGIQHQARPIITVHYYQLL